RRVGDGPRRGVPREVGVVEATASNRLGEPRWMGSDLIAGSIAGEPGTCGQRPAGHLGGIVAVGTGPSGVRRVPTGVAGRQAVHDVAEVAVGRACVPV